MSHLGGYLGALEAFLELWGSLGGSRGPLGALFGHLGALLGLVGGVLGPSWGSLGGSGRSLGAILEAIDQNRGEHLLAPPVGAPYWASLGPSWRPSIKKEGGFNLAPPHPPSGTQQIASWGPLGAFLGRSWGRLGPLLGRSWGRLGPSWNHLEASRAHRKRGLGAVLEPLGRMLWASRSHVGLS